MKKQILSLEEYFENEETYLGNITALNSFFENGEELNGKIDTLYKSILIRKKDIDKLYREIYGYSDTDEDEKGNEIEIHVDGLKDNLEQSYKKIKGDLEEFEKDILETKTQTKIDYESLIEEKNTEFANNIKKWKDSYSSSLKKINDLLPNALTTGLSYAYSEKKKSEEEESKVLARKFRTATYGLVAVSLIPFVISVYSMFDNKTLEQVIMNMPRLVLSILPLYIPVLWLAYSSNKKLNLSKRLIEEYTHKEVLSKTFEGLSTQIENVEDINVSSDLKAKLLYNILSVSSENPGKLISDYNKSDHPLMDALDKSVKLAGAVDKLAEIPGLSSISKVLDKKSKKIVEQESEKIKKGINHIIDEKEEVEAE